MVTLLLSLIGPADAFAAALEAHRAALEAHLSGPAGQAAPAAHPLIESLIVRVRQGDSLPDAFQIAPYEIVDDTPPPPTLAERKVPLMAALRAAQQTANDAVLSPARAALLNLDMTEALAVPEGSRTPAQAACIAAYTAVQSRYVEIERNAAIAAVEIEDIGEADVANWKVPSL